MHKILNKNLHIHIKVKEKTHKIDLGMILLVSLSAAITWFLCEAIVYKLQEISDQYDSIASVICAVFA